MKNFKVNSLSDYREIQSYGSSQIILNKVAESFQTDIAVLPIEEYLQLTNVNCQITTLYTNV